MMLGPLFRRSNTEICLKDITEGSATHYEEGVGIFWGKAFSLAALSARLPVLTYLGRLSLHYSIRGA